MPQAWLVRGSQRQEFIENVMRRIREKEEESETANWQKFLCDLVTVILLEMRENQITKRITEAGSGKASEVEEFFVFSILKPLGNFACTESEKKALMAEILEKVVTSFTREFYCALVREECNNPMAVFRAPSATAEVELT
jgi:hypothetical protein